MLRLARVSMRYTLFCLMLTVLCLAVTNPTWAQDDKIVPSLVPVQKSVLSIIFRGKGAEAHSKMTPICVRILSKHRKLEKTHSHLRGE